MASVMAQQCCLLVTNLMRDCVNPNFSYTKMFCSAKFASQSVGSWEKGPSTTLTLAGFALKGEGDVVICNSAGPVAVRCTPELLYTQQLIKGCGLQENPR